MSADDGIYILETKDGYRVTHAQAIENLWWWDEEPNERDEMNPDELIRYFGNCTIFSTRGEALLEADNIYKRLVNDEEWPMPPEYGIQWITGWENKEFPHQRNVE